MGHHLSAAILKGSFDVAKAEEFELTPFAFRHSDD
jgi:hypothetical protein